MVTLFKIVLLGAAICMLYEGVRTWPTPFDHKSDVIAEMIEADKSLEIREAAFQDILRTMQEE